jgi:hypothetical protein
VPTRMLSRLTCAFMLAATALFLLAAPAVAAPTVSFTDRCGFVLIQIENLGPADIILERNGVSVRTIKGSPEPIDTSQTLGAADGDELVVDLKHTSADPTHTYRKPAGCAAPSVQIAVRNACEGTLVVETSNTGSARITDFALYHTDPDEPLAQLTIPVGKATFPVAVTAGRTIFLARPVVETKLGYVVWQEISSRNIACAPDSIEARFTDDCNRVQINVRATDPDQSPWAYLAARAPAEADGTVEVNAVDAGSPGSHSLPAAIGDDEPFAVLAVTGHPVDGSVPAESWTGLSPGLFITLVAEHQHAPVASCAGGGGGDDGGLPVTGFQAALAAAIGLGLLGTGVLLVLIVRRRRIRFSSAA